jgi:SAM-dependent methyltransferase
MNLKQIFEKHGTDKASKHKYHEIYEPLFEPKKNDEINFLEIGIWKGLGMASLIDYFPNGQIYGADIFTRMTPNDVPILQHERAHYIKADSMSWGITSLLERKFNVEFDYILDDGAHYPEANMLTFRHCSPFLKTGGKYIIEDVWPLEKMTTQQLNHSWLNKYPDRYSQLANAKFLGELHKSGFEIETFDNRNVSGHPDSYVIVLTKT